MPDDPTPPPLPRPVIPIDEPADGSTPPVPWEDPTPPAASSPPAPQATPYPPPATYPPPAYPPPAAYPPLPPAYPPPVQYPPADPFAQGWTPPVDYRTSGATAYARPGFVTTFAVFGIITATLSFLASMFTGCSSMIMLNNAQRGSSLMLRTGRAATVAPPVAAAPQTNPSGLSRGDVGVISIVLRNHTAARGMTALRQRQVEAFFAEHGRLVIEDAAGALTSRKVYEHLGQVGQEYARTGASGAHFFDFKAGPLTKMPGRLRVFDDRAVFDPEDHSETLRSTAASQTAPPTVDEVVDAGLDDTGAAVVVNQIRTYSQNKLNPAQAATLTATLQSPGYSAWVTPSSTVPGLAAQVKSVGVKGDGSMTITFVTARVTLDKDGNVVEGPSGLPAGAAATQPTAPGGAPITFGSVNVSPTSCSLAIGEAALSALLAIFLFVVAILSLRQAPGVRRLYLIYAIAKLALGVVAIVAFAGIISSVNASADQYGYAQAMARGFGGVAKFALSVAIVGMVFPLVVLVAMTMNKDVNAYYRASA